MRLPAVAALWLLLAAGHARAEEAFITNQVADSVTVLDLDAGKAVATIPVAGKPAGIAMAPDGSRAYVTCPDGKALAVIDAAARREVARIDLGGGPLGVAVHPSGSPVYVADSFGNRVQVVDPVSGSITATVSVGNVPSGLAVTPDGNTLIVTERDDNQVALLDTATLARIATIKVGAHPFGVIVDAKGRRAYAANVESDDVSVVDLTEHRLVGTVRVGKRPYVVALARGLGFVTDQYAGKVTVFRLDTLEPLKAIPVGDYPDGIEASADGSHVYVVNWESNTVSVIELGAPGRPARDRGRRRPARLWHVPAPDGRAVGVGTRRRAKPEQAASAPGRIRRTSFLFFPSCCGAGGARVPIGPSSTGPVRVGA